MDHAENASLASTTSLGEPRHACKEKKGIPFLDRNTFRHRPPGPALSPPLMK